jgi:hypothetical protein
MKKLLTILIFSISFFSVKAQIPQVIKTWYNWDYSRTTKYLGLPNDTFAVPVAQRSFPWLAYKNDILYAWSTPQIKWILAGSSGGGLHSTIYFQNIVKADDGTTYDSAFYWRNDSTVAGIASKFVAGSNKLALTRTAYKDGLNRDTAYKYSYDVNEGNLSLQNIGGALNLSQLNAAFFAPGRILKSNGFWVDPDYTLLGTLTIGSISTAIIDISGASGIYKNIELEGYDITTSANTDITVTLSTDGGTTYATTGFETKSVFDGYSGLAGNVAPVVLQDVFGGTSYAQEFRMKVLNPYATNRYPLIVWSSNGVTWRGGELMQRGSSHLLTLQDVDHIKFATGSGTMDGFIKIWGRK